MQNEMQLKWVASGKKFGYLVKNGQFDVLRNIKHQIFESSEKPLT